MRFLSFGFYHYDICLVKHRKLQMDNDSLLHYTMVIRNQNAYTKILENAQKMTIPMKEGRMIKSAKMEDTWIELILKS